MEEFCASKTQDGNVHSAARPLPSLPLRAVPYPWEDLSSLLCRIARKLDYPDPRWLLHPQGSSYGINTSDLPLLSKQRDYLLLQQLLLLDEATLYSLTTHIFAPILDDFASLEHKSPFRLRPQLFASYFLEYPRTRVCPQCLEEDPVYDRLYWRMRYVFFCPLHRIRLRDFCPHCSKTISALRLEPFHCPSCRRGDYREHGLAPIAQDHLLQVGTVLFLRALGITFPEESISWQDEFMLEIRELIAMSDTRLCPAPDLHRKEWHRIPHEQLYYCAVCKRIRESISTSLSQLSSEKKLTGRLYFYVK